MKDKKLIVPDLLVACSLVFDGESWSPVASETLSAPVAIPQGATVILAYVVDEDPPTAAEVADAEKFVIRAFKAAETDDAMAEADEAVARRLKETGLDGE